VKNLVPTPQDPQIVETLLERDQLLSQVRNDSVICANIPLPLLMIQLIGEQIAQREETEEQDEELFNTVVRGQQQNTLLHFRMQQQSKEVLAEHISNKSHEIERRIVRPPGRWMRQITRTVYSKKSNERVFDPLISDYQIEYFDAIKEGADRTRCFFLVVRHSFAFVCAALNQIGSQLLQILVGVMKNAGD
jgi:hypothetical protein